MHARHNKLWSKKMKIGLYKLQSLEFVINRFFMKLLRTSHINVVAQCQKQFGFDSCSVQLDGRRVNFGKKTFASLQLSLGCFCVFLFFFCAIILFSTNRKFVLQNTDSDGDPDIYPAHFPKTPSKW